MFLIKPLGFQNKTLLSVAGFHINTDKKYSTFCPSSYHPYPSCCRPCQSFLLLSASWCDLSFLLRHWSLPYNHRYRSLFLSFLPSFRFSIIIIFPSFIITVPPFAMLALSFIMFVAAIVVDVPMVSLLIVVESVVLDHRKDQDKP
jgi:hypothetical protein